MDNAPSPTRTDPSAGPQPDAAQSPETQHRIGQPDVLESPVFVDGSGRRRRWLARGAYGLAALGVLYVGGLGYSLAAGTVSPDTRLPLAEVIAPVAEALLPAVTPDEEQDSTTVVRRPSGVPTGSQRGPAPALAPNRAPTASAAATTDPAASTEPAASTNPSDPPAPAPAANPAPTAVPSATAPAPSPTGTTAPTNPPAEPSPEPTAAEPTAPEPSLPVDVPTLPGLP